MNILCVGDIFAKPGRTVLRQLLPRAIADCQADFVIVNGENAAGGRGMTPAIIQEFADLPVDVFTSGNHIWQHREAIAAHLKNHAVLRPHNAPTDWPGCGVALKPARNGQLVGVVNLQGRVHMYEGEKHANPFDVARAVVAELRKSTPVIVVDFHAEITAEKCALGYWLDGMVSCLYGTHTHVQTADEQILPKGTAYITDIGMTGARRSVIGARPEDAIRRFLTNGEEKQWKPAEGDPMLHGICVTVDPTHGRAERIVRIQMAP